MGVVDVEGEVWWPVSQLLTVQNRVIPAGPE